MGMHRAGPRSATPALLVLGLLLVGWLSPAVAQPAAPGPKLALVVGNDRYADQPALDNAVRDARAEAATLTGMRFQVRAHENLDRAAMLAALLAFADEARGAEVAVVYYAGHGMQLAADGMPENYLVPVDARLRDVRSVADETVPLTRLLRELDAARVLVVLLDACRDNPVAQRMAGQGMRATTRAGLAPVPEGVSQGALIAFAASPGQFAHDGERGGNGPFATALVKHLPTPGVGVGRVFQRAAAEVRTATRDRQRPEMLNRLLLTNNLFLAGPALASPAPALAPPAAALPVPASEPTVPPGIAPAEAALWAEVRESRNPGDLRAYLDEYPQGVFAPLAQSRIVALAPAAPPAPARTPQPERAGVPHPPVSSGPAAAHDCDRLAQPLRGTMGRVPAYAEGVSSDRIDARAAAAACRRAMVEFPNEPRFVAYAGLAEQKANNNEGAERFFRLAADRDNAVGMSELAWALYFRSGNPLATATGPDAREAVRLHRLAASQGYAASQHVMAYMSEFGAEG